MCKESDYMAYQGYLIQIGGDYKIPHSMISAETYKVTRHGQDLDSTRDESGQLHRNALDHFAIKVEFETPPLKTTAQMEEMLGNIRSRYTNVTEQKLTANRNLDEGEGNELEKSKIKAAKELVEKSVLSINANLEVNQLRYVVVTGEQDSVDAFGGTTSTSKRVGTVSTSTVKYDLVGEIARGATLTRRTVVNILKKLSPAKLAMFQNNPEEFIRNVVKLIKEQKATMIVEHISYNLIEGGYDSTIFTQEKQSQSISKAYPAQKHIMDYVFSDSDGERKFASALDGASEGCVYAKLPRSFQIPTPVGNYAPDWAIAFNKGTVKHIFFIAETKGSLDSMELRGVEKAKIACAKKLFNDVSTSDVRFGAISNYDELLNIIQGA